MQVSLHILSNVIDDHGNLEAMFAPENVLEQSGLSASLISKFDQYLSPSPSRLQHTRKPDSKVTGKAFTGTLEPVFAMLALDRVDGFGLAIFAIQSGRVNRFRKQSDRSIFDIDILLCVSRHMIFMNKSTMMAMTVMVFTTMM
jgi:hypothetical protein